MTGFREEHNPAITKRFDRVLLPTDGGLGVGSAEPDQGMSITSARQDGTTVEATVALKPDEGV